ncbi:3-oxoacyl-(acyl-carrier-protein) synthase [Flavobacteriaceae bacterium MAR_2010_188]|nr:3-oxoacyl-(acyl-carrier-protein) synthase [Flavobacteriaceae bacterium MAR_2010_188]
MSKTVQNNSSSTKIAVTGIGIISALGNDVRSNLAALKSSKSGISDLRFIKTRHFNGLKVGEVKLNNDELSTKLKLKDNHNYTRISLLGCIAAIEAVNNAGIIDIQKYKTALISANTVGGMDMTEQYFKEFQKNPEVQKYIQSHFASDSTEKIADYLGITEYVSTISTACSSAANAIMLGARLIKSGKVERAIVGGTDALSKFTINGFKTLMILSDEVCKPFDAERNGLNLGEGAAFLVLESDEVVKQENKKVIAYLSGYGNANDAFHQTASSENGEGAFLAMNKALKSANLTAKDIDYINAHGTATPNNDLSESQALKRIFKESMPAFSSTKSFTGHTLAAAGALEAVFSILSAKEGLVFPNINYGNSMPETGLSPQRILDKKEIKNVLSNSFGFGGNCSTLIFSKA